MLLRIIRDLTSDEVQDKLRQFEKEFGMNFEKFEELFLKQKLDPRFTRSYFEWAELMDSYKGYIEDGELDYSVEEIKDFRSEQASSLTPKRIELLYQLAALRVESINDLARKVKRNVKNVYEDLEVLSRFGFVRLSKRKGRALTPETLVKEIAFLIR